MTDRVGEIEPKLSDSVSLVAENLGGRVSQISDTLAQHQRSHCRRPQRPRGQDLGRPDGHQRPDRRGADRAHHRGDSLARRQGDGNRTDADRPRRAPCAKHSPRPTSRFEPRSATGINAINLAVDQGRDQLEGMLSDQSVSIATSLATSASMLEMSLEERQAALAGIIDRSGETLDSPHALDHRQLLPSAWRKRAGQISLAADTPDQPRRHVDQRPQRPP